MTTIGQQLVKLNCQHERKTNSIVDVETGQTAGFLRASGLRLEINLTRGGELVDVSNLLTVTIEVKQGLTRNGSLAMSKTIGVGSGIDSTLVQEEHAAKTPGRAHFTFEFSDAETASGVFGASVTDDYECWTVLYGTMTGSGSRIILGTGTIRAVNAGVSGAEVSPPSGGQAITVAEVMSLLQSYVPYDVPAGRAIRFHEDVAGVPFVRTLGLIVDPDQGATRQDDLEAQQ